MLQHDFVARAKAVLEQNPHIIGLAVAGSWLTGELDEFSDVDLVAVTKEKMSSDKAAMLECAKSIGQFISGFTGEHVGEPRVLICLYDQPLLHVDIKFVTAEEFRERIETPEILFDKTGALQQALHESTARFPYPDYQWIEDRFWTWVHYGLLKIGRGEYLEAFDFLGFLRMTVLGPLLHIRNNNLPRGVRKIETDLAPADRDALLSTVSACNRESLLRSLRNAAELYRSLRETLYKEDVQLQLAAETRVMEYFDQAERR